MYMNEQQQQAVKQLMAAFNKSEAEALFALANHGFSGADRELKEYFCRIIDTICSDGLLFKQFIDDLATIAYNVELAYGNDVENFNIVRDGMIATPRPLVSAQLKMAVPLAIDSGRCNSELMEIEHAFMNKENIMSLKQLIIEKKCKEDPEFAARYHYKQLTGEKLKKG